MNGTEVFVHTDLFVDKAQSLRLPLVSWRVLHGLDGTIDLDGLIDRLQLPKPKVYSVIDELLNQGWIQEELLNLEQFESILEKGHSKPPETSSIQPLPASPPAAPAETSPVISEPKPAGPRTLKLARVIEFLLRQAPTPAGGRATVYLVFSRLPHRLLRAAGITNVQLENDPTEILNLELQNAIAAVVYSVTHEPLPEAIFTN